MYTHASLPLHSVIASRHLGNATSHITVAAAAIIIIAIATVATTTRAPCSDRHSLQDSTIALPEVLWNRNAKQCIAEGIGR